MFECSACLRRCLAIFTDNTLPQLASRPLQQPSCRRAVLEQRDRMTVSFGRRRRYAHAALASQASVATPELPPGLTPISDPAKSHPNARSKPAGPMGTEPSIYKRADLEKELKWIQDPLQLADNTVKLLKKGQYNKAYALARLASKDMRCVVTWNHLVDFDMARGHTTAAIRTYNEMKKRAQTPDAHTYTTLFRGLAWNVKNANALERTLSIYHSMFVDKALVRPSIIHTNAVLHVCELAGDMDALLGVAARIPERGAGAANAWTYTIILGAVRKSMMKNTQGLPFRPAAPSEAYVRALRQARIICREILQKWSSGDLRIDEHLIFAMGRALVLGEPSDRDAVFTLVEMTMDVPRQSPAMQEGDVRQRKNFLRDKDESADNASDEILRESDLDDGDIEGSGALVPSDETETSQPLFSGLGNSTRRGLARPGPHTLLLLLEACQKTGLTGPGEDYYQLLTGPKHRVEADSPIYHDYLRLLRIKRASTTALHCMQQMKERDVEESAKRRPRRGDNPPKPLLERKTFRIGLSACNRDKLNQHALQNALAMMRLMLETLETPDPDLASAFLQMVLASPNIAKDWRTLADIEEIANTTWLNLRSKASYTLVKTEAIGLPAMQQVARRMIRLYTRMYILTKESNPQKRLYRDRREKIARWLDERPGFPQLSGPARGSRRPEKESSDMIESERESFINEDSFAEERIEPQKLQSPTADADDGGDDDVGPSELDHLVPRN